MDNETVQESYVLYGTIIRPLLSFSSECTQFLQNPSEHHFDRLELDCQSLLSAVEVADDGEHSDIFYQLNQVLEELIQTIKHWFKLASSKVGRPRARVPIDAVEELLWMKFSVPKIASIFRISVSTLRNRMKDSNLSVSKSHQRILSLPIKSFSRLREAMRVVDPWGVHERLLQNRAVKRRSYFVKYSHSLWHLDTNMKLIRYKVVIRGCIDGKSRFCIYLDVGNNNLAISTMESFMKGVRNNCIPSRTRSDKGGENVLVARFMIETRGVNRGSHLTGRSVHNQRIERFWRDVYRASGYYYETFFEMEAAGMLDIDDNLHMLVLHHVFIPRIQASMEDFRVGWNSHPISTENSCTPQQLLYLHVAPNSEELLMNNDEILEVCTNVFELLIPTVNFNFGGLQI
ncbi:unnamed protein product [Allacma fusca]|uniref:Integrase core domain-containing protein n=1 Tax=Allacma fusca TaxID=39272 RepID=A0A8J2PKH7_9HEXA|nr:unnamed protein product [Allacma fusca]